MLCSGKPTRGAPNSAAGIPIDNKYFKGTMFLMLRVDHLGPEFGAGPGPYDHMFKGKNRMFEVQIQGNFKQVPEGDMYISLEITDKMKIGLLTKVPFCIHAHLCVCVCLCVFQFHLSVSCFCPESSSSRALKTLQA
ncbi:unnamed protein product [Discosporangium mesarthrocarpum]